MFEMRPDTNALVTSCWTSNTALNLAAKRTITAARFAVVQINTLVAVRRLITTEVWLRTQISQWTHCVKRPWQPLNRLLVKAEVRRAKLGLLADASNLSHHDAAGPTGPEKDEN